MCEISCTALRVTTHGSVYASLTLLTPMLTSQPEPDVQCAAQSTQRGAISIAPQRCIPDGYLQREEEWGLRGEACGCARRRCPRRVPEG